MRSHSPVGRIGYAELGVGAPGRADRSASPSAWNGSPRLSACPKPVSVIISIDAEIGPHTSDWERDSGRFAADRDLYGITECGERGLRYQLDILERHDLKAVVFVEALSAGVLGLDLLAEVVGLVQNRGHEVGLHLHTEWLPYYRRPLLGDRYGRNMADFSEDDQVRLIHRGMDHLFRAGVASVAALRAGNAGASRVTLRAALRSGIGIDSSYFAPHLNDLCQLPSKPELSRPVRIEGIIEVPITWFRDGFQRIRPAQICACSIGEFQHILQQAWSRGWHVVTLLLHSFELVRRQSPDRGQTVMRLHDYRFHELCRFLRVHSDKFASTTFRDVDWEGIVGDLAGACLRAPRRLTVRRHFEQAIGRIW